MTTALDLINRGLRLIGAKDPEEEATATEAADGLISLNSMLDSWAIDRLFVYRLAETTYNWPAAQVSATVGSGGNINITRPVRVEDSYIISNSVSYVVANIANKQAYDAIPLKTLSVNYPMWMWYDPAYPLATLYLNPVPASTLEFHFVYWASLQSFAALTDVVSLPPGYERAIAFNLAMEMAPEYGLPVPQSVAAIAASSAGKVKRNNAPVPLSMLEVAYSPRQDNFSIYRGW